MVRVKPTEYDCLIYSCAVVDDTATKVIPVFLKKEDLSKLLVKLSNLRLYLNCGIESGESRGNWKRRRCFGQTTRCHAVKRRCERKCATA